jgi:acyl transferase domain-containing protein
MSYTTASAADPVVVTGFAFRFPGDAVSEEAFWDIIAKGQSTMTEVPESRYNINGFYRNNQSTRDSVSYFKVLVDCTLFTN